MCAIPARAGANAAAEAAAASRASGSGQSAAASTVRYQPTVSLGGVATAPTRLSNVVSFPVSPTVATQIQLSQTPIMRADAPVPGLILPAQGLGPMQEMVQAAPVSAAGNAVVAEPEGRANLPPSLRAVAKLLDETGPGGVSKLSDEQLLELTQKMVGERREDSFTPEYSRPGRALDFGAAETENYKSALRSFKRGYAQGPEEAKILLESARALAQSAGIETIAVIRPSPSGAAHQGLRIVADKNGSLVNKLAYDLERQFGATVEYVPERLIGAVAAYNAGDKVLFLPDFGRADSIAAILHEAAHGQFAKRLARGDLSPFHGQLIAYAGRAIAPGAETYTEHMSLEEIYTHGKQIKVMLAAARRAGDATPESLMPILTTLYQYADVLRSARLNLSVGKNYIASGKVELKAAEAEEAPFPGGKWYRARLPYGWFYIPVKEEAAPKRNLIQKTFGKTPETAAEKAFRVRAETLLTAIGEIDAAVERLAPGLRAETPDLKALNAEADRITASLRRAEERFRHL